MTLAINIQPAPVQNLSATLDDIRYELTIRSTGTAMVVDITREGVLILQSIRAVAGTPLMPYQYLESGNFIFTTAEGDIPFYTKFGVTQSLIFATAEELEGLRSG